jgi:hypothetical protein
VAAWAVGAAPAAVMPPMGLVKAILRHGSPDGDTAGSGPDRPPAPVAHRA